ncbi:U3 small nucleolar RNA interacting protein 2 [Trichuris trichiura]|uniref:U3 small nucleolar RNA interacting protein 2 n=1 Tax=Trichuris trichiura TaxID=36087 RepID=A0A077Z0V1_TRITR|nr:U3 small nucleolar RNA interacting protein 2 [Trichuris trichiura]
MKAEEEERGYQQSQDDDGLAHRLEQEVPGLAYPEMRFIADSVILPSPSEIQVLRGHRLSVTSVALTADGRKAVSGSKDGDILIWDLETSAKTLRLKCQRYNTVGHDYVTSIALSQDGNFLCSGGKDGRINIWDFETGECLKTLQHEGGVTGLSVRTGHNELFSCGNDRSVKLWTLDGFGYVDSMYGHEAPVQDVDSLARQRAITCGGRDHTIRIWKVLEDSQLVFYTEKFCWGSIDTVRLISEDHFVAGSSSGCLSLWSVFRKSPAFVSEHAHADVDNREGWISSLCSVQMMALFDFGNVTKINKYWKKLNVLNRFPVVVRFAVNFRYFKTGFVNSLASANGSLLVAGIGQEHKQGRWWNVKEAVNSVVVIPLKFNDN